MLKTLIIAIIGLSALISCSPIIDKIAQSTLYPFKQVNERIAKRDDMSPPPTAKAISLPSGGNYWSSNRRDGKVSVFYLHGNGESVFDLYDQKLIENVFDRQGWNWAMVDYPGMGIGGTGKPSEESVVNMASEALTGFLRGLEPGSKVFIWGRSLGAAVAAQVAYRNPGLFDGIILVSPWTSFEALVKKNSLGRFISKKFMKANSYKTDIVCQDIEAPVFIVHGTKDKMIPYTMATRLRSCFRYAKLQTVEGAGHNDIYSYESTMQSIRGFLIGN